MAIETILVVDDEESIRQSLAGILRDEGYEIASASSGKEALDLLSGVQPALALLDIAMPEMDGIETLRRFKETRPAGLRSGSALNRSRALLRRSVRRRNGVPGVWLH